MTKHTYDMGVVGNCAFLALIGTDTAVRWLCWPRFDSSFVFGSLLDEQKGGECSVRLECLDFALETNQDAGVWGGLSEEERRVIRRERAAEARRPAV